MAMPGIFAKFLQEPRAMNFESSRAHPRPSFSPLVDERNTASFFLFFSFFQLLDRPCDNYVAPTSWQLGQERGSIRCSPPMEFLRWTTGEFRVTTLSFRQRGTNFPLRSNPRFLELLNVNWRRRRKEEETARSPSAN